MPLPTFNFVHQNQPHIPHDWSNLANLFSNYWKGYEQSHTPYALADAEKKRMADIANVEATTALTNTQNKYLPGQFESSNALRAAQAREHALKAQQLEYITSLLGQALGGSGMFPTQMPSSSIGAPQNMPMRADEMRPPQNMPLYPHNIASPQNLPMYPNNILPPANYIEKNNGNLEYPEMMQPQMPSAHQGALQQPTANPAANDYFLKNIIAHTLGLPIAPPTTNAYGQLITVDPITGAPRVTQVTPTPEEIERSKTKGAGEAKRDLEFDEGVERRLSGTFEKSPVLQTLTEAVNDPNYLLAAGPGMKRLAQLTNNQNVNALIGTLETGLGDLVNKTFSSQFKNQNAREFAAVERMKGNINDNPYALRAKVNLFNALNDFDKRVSEKIIENRKNGMSRVDSEKDAYNSTDFSGVRDLVAKDNLSRQMSNKLGIPYESILEMADKQALMHNDDPYQVLRFQDDALNALARKTNTPYAEIFNKVREKSAKAGKDYYSVLQEMMRLIENE